MSYNPAHIIPPDNIHAVWCDYCGEQIFEWYEKEDYVDLLEAIRVHTDCLPEYATGLQREIKNLKDRFGEMVARGLA